MKCKRRFMHGKRRRRSPLKQEGENEKKLSDDQKIKPKKKLSDKAKRNIDSQKTRDAWMEYNEYQRQQLWG